MNDLVRRAHTVAAYWHRGQLRKSGEPYITHPEAVARILTELGAGDDTVLICAALLHDVLDDTACPQEQLRAEFGDEITDLVLEVQGFAYDTSQPVSERCRTLKLADRLHNMRTADFLPAEKARLKARETLEVFVPMAQQLGLGRLRDELDALATARQGDGGLAFQAVSTGAVLLPAHARDRYVEEWQSDLHRLPGRRERLLYTLQLLASMPRLAAALRTPLSAPRAALGRWLRWLLRSNLRTWAVLTPPLAWLVLDAGSRSEALTLLITIPPLLGAGVEWLRARLKR
ncbi:HD domain-containing protein [Nonomuraea sp. NPDC050663]|uniref:HD domain-containing protein n=1 Tax=Nonomuraea sp. NPDC050663 TaxID=3364370 RepID=UPI00378FAC4B